MRITYETKRYRKTELYSSKVSGIYFVEDKEDRAYDRIKFVRYGNEYSDPEIAIVYRYEDEQFVNHMVETFKNQEEAK